MATRETWIETEAHAYNTYSGGHSRSNRKGRARWPDGKVRAVVLGVPDTAFTIPAHSWIGGKYAAGYVDFDTEANEYRFIPAARPEAS